MLFRMHETTLAAPGLLRFLRMLVDVSVLAHALSLILLTLAERPFALATPMADPPSLPIPEKEVSYEGYGYCLALSADGMRLAAAGQSGQGTCIFDLSTPRAERLIKIAGDWTPTSLAWRKDGKLLACGFSNSTVKKAPIPQVLVLCDSKTGKVVHDLLGHRSGISCVVFSPDGKRLASASGDSSVRLWDVATGKHRRVLHLAAEGKAVAFSPDGKLLASLNGLDQVQLWDATSGDLLATADSADASTRWLAFHAKKTLIACAVNRRVGDSLKGTVVLWEVRDGCQLVGVATLKGPKGSIRRIAFHPDGRHIAACSDDGMVYIWDLKTKKRLHALNHGGSAFCLAFGGDGKRLAVATLDSVTIWNFASRQDD